MIHLLIYLLNPFFSISLTLFLSLTLSLSLSLSLSHTRTQSAASGSGAKTFSALLESLQLPEEVS